MELHEKLNAIGERAFFGCSSLDFIIIPDSVQQIGQDAFTGTDDMFIVQCSLALLQSSIAGRIRLSISWYNVASDATHKA